MVIRASVLVVPGASLISAPIFAAVHGVLILLPDMSTLGLVMAALS